MALLLATPVFAQSRSDWSRNNQSNRGAQANQTRAANQFRTNNTNNHANDNITNRANTIYNRANNIDNRASTITNRANTNNRANNSYRETQRATESGRITSFARERNGYRVRLDRGGSYWVPESRGRGLRVGLSINIGDYLYGNTYYDNAAYVRGVVDNVDYRTGTVWLRDDASGREVRAAVGGYALGSLHSGELVELTGQWVGNGVLSVASVANLQY
jgi:hypothetical protein